MPRKNPQAKQQIILQERVQQIWESLPGMGGSAPRLADLHDFTLKETMESARLEIERAVSGMSDGGRPGAFQSMDRLNFHFEGGAVSILTVLKTWDGIPPEKRPPNPLRTLLEAYIHKNREGSYRRARRGILPEVSKDRQRWNLMYDLDNIPEYLIANNLAHQTCLPELFADDRPKRPALIAVMDKLALLHHERTGGRVGRMDTMPFRIFVELILALNPEERNGQRHDKIILVKTIVEDWLLYSHGNYKPVTKARKIKTALDTVRDLYLPMVGRGYFYPVIIDQLTGLGINDVIKFGIRLPSMGPAKPAVGPPIDLRMMRLLGAESFNAYRAYLGLVYDWDYCASTNGRLIPPTREKMKRTESDQIIDEDGRPVYENGRLVMSQYHPKAVPVGNGERELNPARRRYRQYDEDDILALALPHYMSEDSRYRSRNIAAAIAAVERVAERDACIIEALGSDGGFPWRVMAPDGFNQIPFRDGPEVQYPLL